MFHGEVNEGTTSALPDSERVGGHEMGWRGCSSEGKTSTKTVTVMIEKRGARRELTIKASSAASRQRYPKVFRKVRDGQGWTSGTRRNFGRL